MLITDGHIKLQDNISTVYFGHNLDAQEFIKDFGKIDLEHYKKWSKIELKRQNFCYHVKLPLSFSKDIIKNVEGIMIGSKMKQPLRFPTFVYTLPKPLLREFLGALLEQMVTPVAYLFTEEKEIYYEV